MVYFAVGDLDLDGGVAVTASHNPKEYTGMKIVRRGALPVGGDSGLLDIRDRATALGDTPEGQSLGQVQDYDVWPAYVERVLSFVEVSAISRSASSSTPNGMAGVMLPPVLERLPIEAIRCYFEPDGLSEPRAQPAAPPRTASSSSSGRRARAPTSESPSTATPTAASSSTTRASSCPAIS